MRRIINAPRSTEGGHPELDATEAYGRHSLVIDCLASCRSVASAARYLDRSAQKYCRLQRPLATGLVEPRHTFRPVLHDALVAFSLGLSGRQETWTISPAPVASQPRAGNAESAGVRGEFTAANVATKRNDFLTRGHHQDPAHHGSVRVQLPCLTNVLPLVASGDLGAESSGCTRAARRPQRRAGQHRESSSTHCE